MDYVKGLDFFRVTTNRPLLQCNNCLNLQDTKLFIVTSATKGGGGYHLL